MINKVSNVLVSTSLALTVFASAALPVMAADFEILNGPDTRQEFEIGLGESVEIEIPEAASNDTDLTEFLQRLDDNESIDPVNKTYTDSDNTVYDITGIAASHGDGEKGTRFSNSNRDAYYTEMPVTEKQVTEDGKVTVSETSGKTTEELGGLILDQYDAFRWLTKLQLLSSGSTEYKYLDVKSRKFYTVRIRENIPVSSGESTGGNSSSSDSSSDNEVVIEISREEAEKLQQFYQTNSTVSVGNNTVKSTIDGNFTATSVAGAAITTPKSEVAQALGLKNGETARVTTWDVTAKSSPYAYASLLAGAQSVGGEIGPAIQVNVLKTGANIKTVSDTYNINGAVDMVVGIPANFYVPGATYAVAHVIPGGKYEILKDNDNDPKTVSFPVSAGYGAYALVRIG